MDALRWDEGGKAVDQLQRGASCDASLKKMSPGGFAYRSSVPRLEAPASGSAHGMMHRGGVWEGLLPTAIPCWIISGPIPRVDRNRWGVPRTGTRPRGMRA